MYKRQDTSRVGDFIGWDFGKTIQIGKVHAVIGGDRNAGDKWLKYSLQYSADGQDWTTYKSYEGVTNGKDVIDENLRGVEAVSYTHLDVYKRQDLSKYTDSSAKIYQEAYNVLKAMLDNLSDISAKEFIEAKNNFETAVAKLEEKATVAPIPTPTPNELPASDSAKTGDDVNIFAYVTGLGVVVIVGIYLSLIHI